MTASSTGSTAVPKQDWLAERFEENRGRLRAVAYRMLGSLGEAEDAVQEAWLRLSRSRTDEIENLGGWLTTVVSRVCLDILRSKKARREEPIEPRRHAFTSSGANSPEDEAALADSVGLALLVVLDRLSPAERLSFVLHDVFGVSFEEIGGILNKSTIATRQLAARARKRIHGKRVTTAVDSEHREITVRFLEALRARDVKRIVAVLDPQFVIRIDKDARGPGGPPEVRGAENWALQAVKFAGAATFTRMALVDGDVSLLFAPYGRLQRVLKLTFANGKISAAEAIGDRRRMVEMELAVID
jgi:RNA polymerase sigma factor (sigma-70 family)